MTAAALVSAGLVSVVVFPLLAVTLLSGTPDPTPVVGGRAVADDE